MLLKSHSFINNLRRHRPLMPMSTGQNETAIKGEGSDLSQPAQNIVQYVVLRKDLWIEQSWPLGSVVAQACHASTAAMWESKEDPVTMEYCAPYNIDSMHKVSCWLYLNRIYIGFEKKSLYYTIYTIYR